MQGLCTKHGPASRLQPCETWKRCAEWNASAGIAICPDGVETRRSVAYCKAQSLEPDVGVISHHVKMDDNVMDMLDDWMGGEGGCWGAFVRGYCSAGLAKQTNAGSSNQ